MSALLELAERCEAATGPDRELDRAIQCRDGHGKALKPPPYTASVDAALTLVPDGCPIHHIGQVSDNRWYCGFIGHDLDDRGKGATMALAICAAALRARAA